MPSNNNSEELLTVTIQELDPAEGLEDNDLLIAEIQTDGKVKSVRKDTLLKDEVAERQLQDGALQSQINTMAGPGDTAGSYRVAEKLDQSLKGTPNGVAELDQNGKVPASQLPSFVDDVIEGYYNEANGKFYEHYSEQPVTHDIWSDGTDFYGSDTSESSEPAGTAGSPTIIGTARKASDTFYKGETESTEITVYSSDGETFYSDSEMTVQADIPSGITPEATSTENEYTYSISSTQWFEITAFGTSAFTVSQEEETDAEIISALEEASDLTISYIEYEEGSYTGEITPETGKVYTDLRTNLTYRWGGSAYVKIASDLALGETQTTAYRGDRGKIAYDHSQERGTGTKTANNPHGISPADIGLGNVPNVSTNNQTPTYEEASENSELSSGEVLSTAFGKLAKIVKSVIAHITNKSNPHEVTKAQVGLGNVTNVSTEDVITSGSSNNITSGAVHTALAGKLDSNGTAANSRYAEAIGTSSSHPQVGSADVPVYIDSDGHPQPITGLQVPTLKGPVTFTHKVTANNDFEVKGNIDAKENSLFEKNVTINGNLTVNGATTVVEKENAITSDYLVTRLNNNQGLAQGHYSGIAVSNYANGKMASLSVDLEGTWRVADNAATSTTYTNVALFNSVFYSGLTHTQAEGPTHIITSSQTISASDTVWNDGYYYHFDGTDWFKILSVTNGAFVYDEAVTDASLIATLESLDKYALLYYITVTDSAIDSSQNQPLLTREEDDDLENNDILVWNAASNKAVHAPRPQYNHQSLQSKFVNGELTYEWGNSGSAGVAFVGTRAEYDVAKLISEGQDGFIPPNSIVKITDEDDYVTGENR